MDDNSIPSLHADNSLPSLQAVSQVNNYIQVFISNLYTLYWELNINSHVLFTKRLKS